MAAEPGTTIMLSMDAANHTSLVDRINVEDDSISIFLRESEQCRIVIATLDGDGRPKSIVDWDGHLGHADRRGLRERFRAARRLTPR